MRMQLPWQFPVGRRKTLACAAIAVVLVLPSAADAASPTSSGTPAHTDSKVLPNGRVVDTFRMGGIDIRTVGSRGLGTLNAAATAGASDQSGPHGTFSISSDEVTPKLSSAAGHPSTAVQDLIALGVDPAVAQRDFGDWESPSASLTPGVSLASYRVSADPGLVTLAVTTSSTVPYDTRCYAWNGVASGHINGTACASEYIISANGGDWWIQDKMKATANSNDTSLFPVRLKTISAYISWVSGNLVTDWDPSSTIYRNNCGNVTFGIAAVGEVSVTVDLCPDKTIPYEVTSTSSGAEWIGNELDTDPDGVAAWQEVHSPANVAASWTPHFLLSW